MNLRGGILAAIALLGAGTATAQPAPGPLAFPDLLRAHVDARVGFERLPSGATGAPVGEPAVYVSVTSKAVLLYGTAVIALDRGRPSAGEVQACASAAPCLPAVRDAVRRARADLARETRQSPDVLLVAAGDAPYATLLLVVRSVAEAGAARSMKLVTRADQQLRALTVWTTPGRRIAVGDAANPAIIASSIGPDRAVTVATTRFYSRAPRRFRGIGSALSYLGRLQLQSGRSTHFISGAAGARVADVAALAVAASDIFEHVALAGRGERTFAVTRSR